MEENKKNVSLPVIKRLPRYYRYLGDLLDNNITRISSKELSNQMKITASQIRQDLNNFGCFGQQGYGYNVKLLYKEIQQILGLEKDHSLVIIGAGNIGQALINYQNFKKRGFNFVGIFDVNPKLVGVNIRGLEVQDVDTLEDFIKKHNVDIAVLTLSQSNAIDMAENLISYGIRGIWNFSNVELHASDKVKIENVHLTDSLMTLSYRLNEDKIVGKYSNDNK